MLPPIFARIMSPGVLLVCVALATVGAWAPVAHAAPSAADRATARTLAQQGYEALRNKDYATAADRFSRADALVHAPTLLLDLARAQVGLGKLVDAYENYNRIIREGVAPDAPPSWARALEAANVEILTIAPRLAWVTISVRGPYDPRVVLDGRPIRKASLGVKRAFDPGRHVVRASGHGYVPQEREFEVSEGETLEVVIELEPAPEAVALEDEEQTTPAQPERKPGWRKPATIIAFGVGGAGLLAGGIGGALALAKHGELSDACPNDRCPADQQSNVDAYHRFGLVSTVGFVVAGAGGALGLVFLLTEPTQEPRPQAAGIRPFVGLGNAGIEGTF